MATNVSPRGLLAASALAWALDAVRLDGKRFAPYPYEAALLADRSPRQIILKARQVGITLAVVIREAHAAIFRPGSLCLIVSRDQRAAGDVLQRIGAIFGELDDPPELTRESALEITLANGSRIVSQPATAKAGRGLRAHSVILDEFAFAEHDVRIYRAALPTLSRGGRLTVISTPNGMANLFYRLWHDLEGGEWSRHRVHWSDCPAFDAAWYERERPQYTAQDWAGEYECDFIESGQAVFDAADVAAMRNGWSGLQPPLLGRRYVHGWDVGRRRDPTVGVTLDATAKPYQVVAFKRMVRAPYAATQAAIDARASEFGGETWVESNSIGDPIIEALRTRVRPFTTTARSKGDALALLVRLIEQGEIKCGVPDLLAELTGYQWDDSRLVQDSVMACAIAAWAADHSTVGRFFTPSDFDHAFRGDVRPLKVAGARS